MSLFIKYRIVFLFLIKFIILLTILRLCYYCYIGLIDPKGDLYSPFLAHYSIVNLLLAGIIFPVKLILMFLGFEVRNSMNSVGILDSNGVFIAYPCLGIGLMIIYFSFIVTYPSEKNKFLNILIGFVGIYFINILRILTIILANHYYSDIPNKNHDYFNLIGLMFIICMLYFYVSKSNVGGSNVKVGIFSDNF